jgi:hypothetical protein
VIYDYIPPLRGVPGIEFRRDMDNPPELSMDDLKAQNERLTELAAKYWVLRDAINWQIKAGKRVPKAIRLIFEAQMAEIDAELQQ